MLGEWQQQLDEEPKPAADGRKSGNADEHRLPVKGSQETKSH
jgi:hypothetical protein